MMDSIYDVTGQRGARPSRFPAMCIFYVEISQASSDMAQAHRKAFTAALKFRSLEHCNLHVRGELKHTARCQVGIYPLHDYAGVPVITQWILMNWWCDAPHMTTPHSASFQSLWLVTFGFTWKSYRNWVHTPAYDMDEARLVRRHS
jgi:hypothetical protein